MEVKIDQILKKDETTFNDLKERTITLFGKLDEDQQSRD